MISKGFVVNGTEFAIEIVKLKIADPILWTKIVKRQLIGIKIHIYRCCKYFYGYSNPFKEHYMYTDDKLVDFLNYFQGFNSNKKLYVK